MVVARVHRASVNPELVNEYVHVRISSIGLDSPGRGIIKASAPLNEVELELQVGSAQSPGAGVVLVGVLLVMWGGNLCSLLVTFLGPVFNLAV